MNAKDSLPDEAKLIKLFGSPLLGYELGPEGTKFEDDNGDLYFVVQVEKHLWYVPIDATARHPQF